MLSRIIGIVILVALLVTVYALIDCIMTSKRRLNALPRAVWILLILLLPIIGGVVWLFVGKVQKSASEAHMAAPDDDPDFLRTLRHTPRSGDGKPSAVTQPDSETTEPPTEDNKTTSDPEQASEHTKSSDKGPDSDS